MFPSRKPRVLIYTGHIELLGGDAHYAFGLINKLSELGVSVELLTDQNKLFRERAEAWLSADVPIHYLNTRPVLFAPNFLERSYSALDQQKEILRGYRRWFYSILSYSIFSRKCYTYLMFLFELVSLTYIRNYLVNSFVFYNVFRKKKGTVDIFHFNNGGFPAKTAGIFAIMMARFFCVKSIVMTVHNIPRSRLTPMDLFYDFVIRTCRVKVIAASDRVRQVMATRRKIPGFMIQTIRCGLEDLSLLSPSECSVKRSAMELELDRPILLITGNYEEDRKGHIPLLEALAHVKLKFSKVLLLIVGTGSEGRKQMLESIINRLKISDKVLFLGFRRDIYELNSIADICLTPSTRNESIPYTIIEAARVAKPVITTTVGGCKEAVEDGVTGYVVEPNNPLLLAEKIETLLASRVLREKMGSAAKKLFIERFLLDKRIEDHLVVYNDCLSNDLS